MKTYYDYSLNYCYLKSKKMIDAAVEFNMSPDQVNKLLNIMNIRNTINTKVIKIL